MATRDGTLTIVQISDLHCGTQFFLPNLLERDADGRVLEAFTPYLYLPEQDLYVEVTVMKQSLVTRKNRKLRKLRELHPEIRIKLFYKRDIERLAQRYRLDLAS